MLKEFKNKKAPALDKINIEWMKYVPTILHAKLLDVFIVCSKLGDIPKKWKPAVVMLFFKMGTRLLNTCYKIQAKTLTNCVFITKEHVLQTAQCIVFKNVIPAMTVLLP